MDMQIKINHYHTNIYIIKYLWNMIKKDFLGLLQLTILKIQLVIIQMSKV